MRLPLSFDRLLWLLALLVQLVAIACPVPAKAEYRIELSPSFIHEDNLFRLSPARRAVLPHDGGDRIVNLAATGAIDLTRDWGSVSAQGTIARQRFARFNYLDNTAYAASLLLQRSERSGSIVVQGAIQRRLTSFDDNFRSTRDIQRLTTASAEATRAVFGDFRLVGRVNLQDNRNSDPLLARADYMRIGYLGGFGYYSPTGSILALEGSATRAGHGSGVVTGSGIPRTAFRERAIQLHLLWLPSVLWRVDARGGYTRHRDRSGTGSNFAGLTGNASLRWSPRESIQIEAAARRQFESQSAVFSNGIRTSAASVRFTGRATPRLTAELGIERRWRLFRFDVQAPAQAGRSERITEGEATLTYSPSRRAALALTAETGRRTASRPEFRYRYASFTATLRIGFGNGAAPTVSR